MKTLFENEYHKVLLDEDEGIFELRYSAKSSELYGDAFIREIILVGDIMEAHQTKDKRYNHLLLNTLKGGPTMEKKVQEYMHDTVFPRSIEIGITAKAYCVGEEIISRLSIELTSENAPNSQVHHKFFSTREDGWTWLKSL